MCLTEISDVPFEENEENGYKVGYKIFRKSKEDNTLHSVFKGDCLKNIPVKRWINEKEYRVPKSDYEITVVGPEYSIFKRHKRYYKTGFHIYSNRKVAEYHKEIIRPLCSQFEVHKVYYKDVTAYGWEGLSKVIVAKKIFILDEKIL